MYARLDVAVGFHCSPISLNNKMEIFPLSFSMAFRANPGERVHGKGARIEAPI